MKLPNKPSELLMLALEDMEKSLDKGYEIRMSNWVEPKCSVCMAGAIMLNTLNVLDEEAYFPDPEIFDQNTRDKLYAINAFKKGKLEHFESNLGIDTNVSDTSDDGYGTYVFYGDLDNQSLNDLLDYTIGMIGYYQSLGL